MPRLTSRNRLALLLHGVTGKSDGKMAYGLLRYGVAPVVCVIDRAHAGGDLRALTGIPQAEGIPIVATVAESLAFRPDVLIPAIAPSGGVLPPDWFVDVREAFASGMSLINGMHAPLASDPHLAAQTPRSEQFIWDVRQEPPGLKGGAGRARNIPARRVLFVGTDMAVGKMSTALEADREARKRGLESRFLATGQIGIVIAGNGIALDAVRVDFASGAVEKLVLDNADGADVLFVEGQGSLLHPASTATLPLLRGAMPTHLVLVHRAGQKAISRSPWVPIAPLDEVVRLYEAIASAAGAFTPAPRVVAVALNTGHLQDEELSRQTIAEAAQQTGLPVTDPVRFGAATIVDAIFSSP